MTRFWRSTLALLLCGAGAVLGPSPTASAAPAADAGVGRVVADLGTVPYGTTQPGFSFDGAYYASLVVSGDRCDLHLYDLSKREQVALSHAHVVCGSGVRWAADADTLVWQVNAAAGDVTVYGWDADPGQVSVLAPDAHVLTVNGVSADGRYLAFNGRSDTHPAPSVDAPQWAGYVYDRTADVSLPLSKPDLHVQFFGWGPTGSNFIAQTGGRSLYDAKSGSCFGSGTSCHGPSDDAVFFSDGWSRDGTAVVGDLVGGGKRTTTVYDFTDDSLTPFPSRAGSVNFSLFLGADADRVLGYLLPGAVVWDRRTGQVSKITSPSAPDPSPTGRYLLYLDAQPDVYRYVNVSTGAAALATFRGVSKTSTLPGYWTKDGSSYIGVGPGGCTSLRQWSPATNTVSLFDPPGTGACYRVPIPNVPGTLSSASGRFALVFKEPSNGAGEQEYFADLRRHVLIGPLIGSADPFAPAGAAVVPVHQRLDQATERLLLVDPTPVPDVDDKPWWSAATPATGSPVEVAAGGQVHVTLGASDLQQTPVNLTFRWRTAAGVPVSSAPKGWSCDRKRLAAGATLASCTFAPPKDPTAVRFLDVWAVNYVTGAQSDTRSYRVGTR